MVAEKRRFQVIEVSEYRVLFLRDLGPSADAVDRGVLGLPNFGGV